MNPAHETLEQLFDRFRRTRDAACLGRVFDRCADELFAVALHVCPDRATAEDVLQATFLTAIERASRYATTRPLVPWLLGILHREAKRARRRARRAPDPARLGRNAATAPPQLLVAEEARSEVGAAIAQMPQPYRDVLELHLVQALPAGAIAAQLSRSPGAVRTQLWRGLERLRRLLPPGLALGGAGALASRPVLAAVRERIVRSAHVAVPTTAGIGTSLILGGIMLKQVLIAVGVVTAIVFVWWQGATVDLLPDPEPVASSAAPQAAGGLAAAPPPTERGAADRSSVAAASAAPPPTDAAGAPAAPPAVMLGILAVDAAGEPVADAEVRVFEERDRRRGIELWRGRSDAAGRCRAFVADSVLVSARKTGVGWSGDVAVRAHGAGAEVRAVILPTATIHGVVLDATGEPASGALVTCHASDFEAGLRPEPPPARTREDGTFEVEVLPRHEYRVHAQVGDRHARPVTVSALAADARQEVTLRVPGAFSVRGRLENATGAPLAKGQIRLLRRDTSPAERTRRAETDADGRFAILLTEDGTYDVVGGVQGETSAVAVAVLAAARPHVEVTLRTAPFVAIEGIVRDDRGTPLGDVLVGARQDRDRDPVSRERIDLQGGYGGIRTAADGTFRFEAAAGFPYELRAQAIPGNRELWATGPTVVAPASGVVVVVRDVDRQGFTIAGRVLRAADGSPVARARIARITHHGSGASHGPVGTAVDGEFEVGPLAVGARYSFEFEAPELAPVVVGPFEAGLRREEVTVRLPEFGRVRCRVQRPDGTVAVGVFVSLNFEPYDPFGPAWQGDTDADGVIEFERVPPRAYRVHAAAKAAIGGEADVETVVASGQATDVTVVLSK